MNYSSLNEKKSQLDQFRQKEKGLPPELVKNLDDWFRVELTYTSNAIEGNTLTRRETALVVEQGLTVGGKSLVEHLEATNHAFALDWVKDLAAQKHFSISERDILTIHSLILKGIEDDHAGKYRTVPVRISGSTVVLPIPLKVPDLMEEFCEWLKSKHDLHPVELAAEAHYQLVTIHPFVDGNGRTARLLMNLILLLHGYPPAIIRKRDRLAYIGSLEKAQLGGSKDDYFKIISKAVERSLNIYLKALKGEPEKQESDELIKIGALASMTNETVATIRFWTKEGLIQIADKTPSNYALYSVEMADTIKQIQELKKQRFTLDEIKKQLDLS